MNKEHYKIIKQGVRVWNAWREEHPDVVPDLEGVNLKGANLSRVNLNGANLCEATVADAYIKFANLDNTTLNFVDLSETIIIETSLNGANLCGTGLENTCFIDANLYEADFFQTALYMTCFSNVDLSSVKGLDSAIHHGPSYVDIHTLYKSKGNIPESFLRGCGVPDNLIEYLPSLTGKAIEYYSCFISYSSKDEAFAKRLHADLQNSGVRCWYAPEDMKIGDKIRPVIHESIRIHDKLLIILSEASVASDWVEDEVERALDLERERKKPVLFPVRLDAAVMESDSGWSGSIKRSRHIGDFTQWKEHDAYQESFERLLRDLKTDDDL
jgi:hypothetical protein